jgi:hypothetical protein
MEVLYDDFSDPAHEFVAQTMVLIALLPQTSSIEKYRLDPLRLLAR